MNEKLKPDKKPSRPPSENLDKSEENAEKKETDLSFTKPEPATRENPFIRGLLRAANLR
jgi:hypothetical protein